MRQWGSKPQSVTARTLYYAAIEILSNPSAPQFLLPFSGSLIPFLPPPGPIPYLPPPFTGRYRFSISMNPLLPPKHTPGKHHRLPDSTDCLCFPPLLGIPRSSLREPVSEFPHLVAPPFPSSTFTISSLLSPGLSHPRVPSSLFLSPPSARPLPLPSNLDWCPSPLPVPGGGAMFFVPPFSAHSPRPPPVPQRPLMTSEV